MNEQNQGGLGNSVPLEPTSTGPIYQNAGGPGKVLPTDNVYTETGGAAATLAAEYPASAPMPTSTPVPLEPSVPNTEMAANMVAPPNAEPTPIRLNVEPNLEAEEEYEELEEITPSKSEEELALEKRNASGMRFVIIFGLIILLFILLLPFIVTLI